MKPCECGCGQEVRNRFAHGHNTRIHNVEALLNFHNTPLKELIGLYRDEHLSCREIAEKYRVGLKAVHRKLQKFGITQTLERSWNWHGGKQKNSQGYIKILLREDSPFYQMADSTCYVAEHRLVMAQHLGRCLSKSEIVHHKNGIRDDNRFENLALLSSTGDHTVKTMLCQDCDLRKDIRLLRWQIKEQSEQIRNLTAKLMLGEKL